MIAKTSGSNWHQAEQILVTYLQGKCYLEDISLWSESLKNELDRLEENDSFKLLVNMYGYQPGELAAHKAMRSVIPLLLADYNFQTGLLDVVAPQTLPLQKKRGITCTAVAHLHHDVEKMKDLDLLVGRDNERFFSDYNKTSEWLRTGVNNYSKLQID